MNTKRILVWLFVLVWCVLSLCIDVRAQGTIDLSPLPEFTEQRCSEPVLAANTIVIKKKTVASAAGGAPSYLVQEGAEGAGTPSGWTDVNDAGGTIDWDYTTVHLAGAQSLYVESGTETGNGTWKAFTGTDPVYGFFIVAGNGANDFFELEDSSGNQIFAMYVSSTNLYVWDGSSRSSSFVVAEDGSTPTYIWWHYDAGGIIKVYASTTTTKPAVTINVTDSGQTATGARVKFLSTYDNIFHIFDSITVSATDITGVP